MVSAIYKMGITRRKVNRFRKFEFYRGHYDLSERTEQNSNENRDPKITTFLGFFSIYEGIMLQHHLVLSFIILYPRLKKAHSLMEIGTIDTKWA